MASRRALKRGCSHSRSRFHFQAGSSSELREPAVVRLLSAEEVWPLVEVQVEEEVVVEVQ